MECGRTRRVGSKLYLAAGLGGSDEMSSSYSKRVDELRRSFKLGKTRPTSYRVEQLKAMDRFLADYHDRFVDALKEDLNKNKFESILFEIQYTRNEIKGTIMELDKWVKPEKAPKNIMLLMDQALIHSEPFGVALVIGAWNYPLQLTLCPLIGAIAAGNCAVIKPSEQAPATAKLLLEMVPKYLDPECFAVIVGGPKESAELLTEKFDYIFYTGSTNVGKLIYAAAQKHLTPVTLELGGKSPVYVDAAVNLEVACRRLMWGKYVNAGQTCIAPDYVLCHTAVYAQFVDTCKKVITEFYSEHPKDSADLGRIVNTNHCRRIAKLLEGLPIAFGGDVDVDSKYVAPTLVTEVKVTDPVMQEEIFGPVLPILRVNSADEAIEFINEREKPLTLYVFSSQQKVIDRFMYETTSGSICANDTLVHLSVDTLPFGGVGQSGMGRYHGKYSFDTFSNKKAVLVRSFNPIGEAFGRKRYPPLDDFKIAYFRQLLLKRGSLLGTGLLGCAPYLCVFVLGVASAFLLRYLFHDGSKLPQRRD
ncbi:aldehyde dehydrogenase, dimeric NADP-preferring isoform X4 [Dermacentor andersoni]|uniref:aldehyde dehydrogenase, dimeric NADP-preferring isoform X4 n=1 Tax=Dermacentor andersoni TaxID=34620 RepID=UPI0024179DC1|nr:aldehyde dehydrogenase, dimeric NADP-preferring-like isoform X4 [Dermacentor andersoni]